MCVWGRSGRGHDGRTLRVRELAVPSHVGGHVGGQGAVRGVTSQRPETHELRKGRDSSIPSRAPPLASCCPRDARVLFVLFGLPSSRESYTEGFFFFFFFKFQRQSFMNKPITGLWNRPALSPKVLLWDEGEGAI